MVAGVPDGPAERLIDATLGRADEMDLPSGAGAELRTFVFADIRGYTEFTQRRGDEAAEILTATFASTTRDKAAEYDGTVLELRGDEALCVFVSPRQSLRFAVALQQRFVQLTAADPDHPMTVGIGADVGEAVRGPDGYRGGALNLAARLCARARAGEILATVELSHLARTIDGVRYEQRSPLTLKGLAEPVRPVRVVPVDVDPVQELTALLAGQAPTRRTARWVPPPFARRPRVTLAVVTVALLAAAAAIVLAVSTGDAAKRAQWAENSLVLLDPGSGAPRATVHLPFAPGPSVSDGHAVWTVDPDADLVSRVDLVTHDIRQISVGEVPVAIAVGLGSVWVADNGSGSVTQIDPATGDAHEISGVGVGPSGIAVGDGSVWVTVAGDGEVARIDPVRSRVVERIPVGDGPTGITVAHDVWVTDSTTHSVARINGAGPMHHVVQTYPVGNGPIGIVALDGAMWTANSIDGTVSRIPLDGTGITSLPAGPEPSQIIAAGGSLWVASHATGVITALAASGSAAPRPLRIAVLPAGLASAREGVWVATTFNPAAHRGGTLNLVGDPLLGVDPSDAAHDPASFWLLNGTFDSLVGYEHAPGAQGALIVPDLAVALPDVSLDGRTYAFQLRRGIRWSTGAPVTVNDIRRGLQRAVLSAPEIFGAIIAGASRCSTRRCPISGISVDVAARTIRITLTHPDAAFLDSLTGTYAVPAATPLATNDRRIVAATGPYEVDRYVPGRIVSLSRNPYFHEWSHAAQPAGYPSRIAYRSLGPSATMRPAGVAAVLRGDADWADGRGVDDLEGRFGARLHVLTSATLHGLSLNTAIAPFDDRRVRRALAYALDRQAVARKWFTPATPTCQFVPPRYPGHRPYCPYGGATDGTGRWLQTDLARGQHMLRGVDKSVPISVWSTPLAQPALTEVVSALRALGFRHVKLHIDADDMNYFGTVANSRSRIQAAFYGWLPGDASADDLLSVWRCDAIRLGSDLNLNPAQFCSHAVDALIDTARRLQRTSVARAGAAWHRVDVALVNAAPWIPLVNPTWEDVVSTRVTGFERNLWLGPLFDQMRVR